MSYRVRFYTRLALDSLRALVSVPLECRGPTSTTNRVSPQAALRLVVGGHEALLCYGRPSARGRRVFGELVPYGDLWRLGANEPTVLHLPFPANVAGIHVRTGKLALYAIPDRESWTVVLNRSTRQWGLTRSERGRDGHVYTSAYTPSVRRAELGRAVVETSVVSYVEQLTARAEASSERRTDLVFDWETTSVSIPIEI